MASADDLTVRITAEVDEASFAEASRRIGRFPVPCRYCGFVAVRHTDEDCPERPRQRRRALAVSVFVALVGFLGGVVLGPTLIALAKAATFAFAAFNGWRP